MSTGNSTTSSVPTQVLSLPIHPLFKDLSGQRFGRLSVIRYAGPLGKSRVSSWLCVCDCGKEVVVKATRLQTKTTRSCGCYGRERRVAARTTHGKSGTATYNSWCKMKERCEKPATRGYRHYGGRGIRVCDNWSDSFEAFLRDMGLRPEGGYEIDRIDVNGHYEAGNCRWITRRQNARNKRSNRRLTWDGKTLCLSEWSEVLGLPAHILSTRLRRGWSIARTLTTPLRRVRRWKHDIEALEAKFAGEEKGEIQE